VPPGYGVSFIPNGIPRKIYLLIQMQVNLLHREIRVIIIYLKFDRL
jgi:hypothetical protein